MLNLKPGFIEEVDHSVFTLYADTDSSYQLVPLPFSKFEDQHKTVDYTQKVARLINNEFLKLFNETVVKHGGVNPKYVRMDFKSEVVAYRGFFNTKKNYALAKIWDEGKYFTSPYIKKTGGQIVKSDSTPIILDILTEIYEVLLLDFSITDEVQLYRKIFIDLKNKYIQRTKTSVQSFNLYDFGIPKKWGMKTLKTVPKQVQGAMLYNYLFADSLRPGEGMVQIQVWINVSKLVQYMDSHPEQGGSKFQITTDMVTDKLNVISFPVDLTPDEIINIQKVFQEIGIQFDINKIMEFNIIKKIEQFRKIFKPETIRMAI